MFVLAPGSYHVEQLELRAGLCRRAVGLACRPRNKSRCHGVLIWVAGWLPAGRVCWRWWAVDNRGRTCLQAAGRGSPDGSSDDGRHAGHGSVSCCVEVNGAGPETQGPETQGPETRGQPGHTAAWGSAGSVPSPVRCPPVGRARRVSAYNPDQPDAWSAARRGGGIEMFRALSGL